MRGDATEPVAARCAPIEVRREPGESEKSGVKHILDLARAVGHPIEDAPDISGVPIVKHAERARVSCADGLEQLGVGAHPRDGPSLVREGLHRRVVEAPNRSPTVQAGAGGSVGTGYLALTIELGAASESSVTVSLHQLPVP
jgi:hypothetical protein